MKVGYYLKVVFCGILCVTGLFVMNAVAENAADLNNDGIVNAYDVSFLKGFVYYPSITSQFVSDAYDQANDINGDGIIDNTDYNLLYDIARVHMSTSYLADITADIFAASDLDQDGQITYNDYRALDYFLDGRDGYQWVAEVGDLNGDAIIDENDYSYAYTAYYMTNNNVTVAMLALGDIDKDGETTYNDSSLLSNYISRVINKDLTPENFEKIDINGDAQIDNDDVNSYFESVKTEIASYEAMRKLDYYVTDADEDYDYDAVIEDYIILNSIRQIDDSNEYEASLALKIGDNEMPMEIIVLLRTSGTNVYVNSIEFQGLQDMHTVIQDDIAALISLDEDTVFVGTIKDIRSKAIDMNNMTISWEASITIDNSRSTITGIYSIADPEKSGIDPVLVAKVEAVKNDIMTNLGLDSQAPLLVKQIASSYAYVDVMGLSLKYNVSTDYQTNEISVKLDQVKNKANVDLLNAAKVYLAEAIGSSTYNMSVESYEITTEGTIIFTLLQTDVQEVFTIMVEMSTGEVVPSDPAKQLVLENVQKDVISRNWELDQDNGTDKGEIFEMDLADHFQMDSISQDENGNYIVKGDVVFVIGEGDNAYERSYAVTYTANSEGTLLAIDYGYYDIVIEGNKEIVSYKYGNNSWEYTTTKNYQGEISYQRANITETYTRQEWQNNEYVLHEYQETYSWTRYFSQGMPSSFSSTLEIRKDNSIVEKEMKSIRYTADGSQDSYYRDLYKYEYTEEGYQKRVHWTNEDVYTQNRYNYDTGEYDSLVYDKSTVTNYYLNGRTKDVINNEQRTNADGVKVYVRYNNEKRDEDNVITYKDERIDEKYADGTRKRDYDHDIHSNYSMYIDGEYVNYRYENKKDRQYDENSQLTYQYDYETKTIGDLQFYYMSDTQRWEVQVNDAGYTSRKLVYQSKRITEKYLDGSSKRSYSKNVYQRTVYENGQRIPVIYEYSNDYRYYQPTEENPYSRKKEHIYSSRKTTEDNVILYDSYRVERYDENQNITYKDERIDEKYADGTRKRDYDHDIHFNYSMNVDGEYVNYRYENKKDRQYDENSQLTYQYDYETKTIDDLQFYYMSDTQRWEVQINDAGYTSRKLVYQSKRITEKYLNGSSKRSFYKRLYESSVTENGVRIPIIYEYDYDYQYAQAESGSYSKRTSQTRHTKKTTLDGVVLYSLSLNETYDDDGYTIIFKDYSIDEKYSNGTLKRDYDHDIHHNNYLYVDNERVYYRYEDRCDQRYDENGNLISQDDYTTKTYDNDVRFYYLSDSQDWEVVTNDNGTTSRRLIYQDKSITEKYENGDSKRSYLKRLYETTITDENGVRIPIIYEHDYDYQYAELSEGEYYSKKTSEIEHTKKTTLDGVVLYDLKKEQRYDENSQVIFLDHSIDEKYADGTKKRNYDHDIHSNSYIYVNNEKVYYEYDDTSDYQYDQKGNLIYQYDRTTKTIGSLEIYSLENTQKWEVITNDNGYSSRKLVFQDKKVEEKYPSGNRKSSQTVLLKTDANGLTIDESFSYQYYDAEGYRNTKQIDISQVHTNKDGIKILNFYRNARYDENMKVTYWNEWREERYDNGVIRSQYDRYANSSYDRGYSKYYDQNGDMTSESSWRRDYNSDGSTSYIYESKGYDADGKIRYQYSYEYETYPEGRTKRYISEVMLEGEEYYTAREFSLTGTILVETINNKTREKLYFKNLRLDENENVSYLVENIVELDNEGHVSRTNFSNTVKDPIYGTMRVWNEETIYLSNGDIESKKGSVTINGRETYAIEYDIEDGKVVYTHVYDAQNNEIEYLSKEGYSSVTDIAYLVRIYIPYQQGENDQISDQVILLIQGDLNRDGTIDSNDMSFLINVSQIDPVALRIAWEGLADLNNDGVVNSSDMYEFYDTRNAISNIPDLNKDGLRNFDDIKLFRNALATLNGFQTDEIMLMADVNADGYVNSNDIYTLENALNSDEPFAFDMNNDGVVSDVDIAIAQGLLIYLDRYARVQMDLNGDGAIDYEDFDLMNSTIALIETVDFNNDGVIDYKDQNLLSSALYDVIQNGVTEEVYKNCDLNRDAVIDASDIELFKDLFGKKIIAAKVLEAVDAKVTSEDDSSYVIEEYLHLSNIKELDDGSYEVIVNVDNIEFVALAHISSNGYSYVDSLKYVDRTGMAEYSVKRSMSELFNIDAADIEFDFTSYSTIYDASSKEIQWKAIVTKANGSRVSVYGKYNVVDALININSVDPLLVMDAKVIVSDKFGVSADDIIIESWSSSSVTLKAAKDQTYTIGYARDYYSQQIALQYLKNEEGQDLLSIAKNVMRELDLLDDYYNSSNSYAFADYAFSESNPNLVCFDFVNEEGNIKTVQVDVVTGMPVLTNEDLMSYARLTIDELVKDPNEGYGSQVEDYIEVVNVFPYREGSVVILQVDKALFAVIIEPIAGSNAMNWNKELLCIYDYSIKYDIQKLVNCSQKDITNYSFTYDYEDKQLKWTANVKGSYLNGEYDCTLNANMIDPRKAENVKAVKEIMSETLSVENREVEIDSFSSTYVTAEAEGLKAKFYCRFDYATESISSIELKNLWNEDNVDLLYKAKRAFDDEDVLIEWKLTADGDISFEFNNADGLKRTAIVDVATGEVIMVGIQEADVDDADAQSNIDPDVAAQLNLQMDMSSDDPDEDMFENSTPEEFENTDPNA